MGFRIGEPTVLTGQVFAPIAISDALGFVGSGSILAMFDEVSREVVLAIETTEGPTHRVLYLTAFAELSVMRISGTIMVDDQPILTGGWLYSGGLVETPDTDSGFSWAVAEMLHVVPGGGDTAPAPAAAMGFTLGDLGSMIGNIISMLIHYWRDAFIAYTAPEPGDCDGPTFEDTCEEGDVPCRDQIADLCVAGIDAIPDVSDAFKKCMKGRCGCGGSTFPTIRVTCADSTDCGPCGSGADGCNIGGTTEWYCDPGADECACTHVVFHEMSHACAMLDDAGCNYSSSSDCSANFEDYVGACRMGFFFQDVCCDGGVCCGRR